MLKVLSISLLFATSFAQDKPKTWDQLIANGESAKLATTLLLNEAYQKRNEQSDKSEKPEDQVDDDLREGGGLEFLPDNTDEITNFELFNRHNFFHYYKNQSSPYYTAAVHSIKGKSPTAALEDEKYKAFREFLIYGQKNPRLKDLLPDLIVNDEETDPTLLKTLLQDPNPELRASFARSFWRSLTMHTDDPKNYYETVKLFLEQTNKDDLLDAFKNFDNKGLLSDEFRYCSPQFWTVARLLTGEQKGGKFGSIIDKKISEKDDELNECLDAKALRDLSDDDYRKLATVPAYEKSFWSKMHIESSKLNDAEEKITEAAKQKQKDEDQKWLQQIIKLLVNKTGTKTAPASGTKTQKN